MSFQYFFLYHLTNLIHITKRIIALNKSKPPSYYTISLSLSPPNIFPLSRISLQYGSTINGCRFSPFCFQRDGIKFRNKARMAKKDRRTRRSEFSVEFRREGRGIYSKSSRWKLGRMKSESPLHPWPGFTPTPLQNFHRFKCAICINKKNKEERGKRERGEKVVMGGTNEALSIFFFSSLLLPFPPLVFRKKLAVPLVVATSLFTFCSVCGENENRFFSPLLFFLEREKRKKKYSSVVTQKKKKKK